jgi:hypothetical protein
MTQPFDNRDWDQRQIAEKDAEIERLKALCGLAADALEEEFGPAPELLAKGKQPWVLMAELRKAAQ